ncbi:MAG: alpha/beta hydrolase [Alphaproteobacteria bacterium]|nr:alpha/beta hydrolase [Alphaproteobacteria bacterium]
MWRDFPQRLSQATECPAFVYSRLGYGTSDPAPKPWRRQINYIQDDALSTFPKVLDAASIDDMVLIGHSDGASMALVYAASGATGVRGVIVEAAHMNAEPATLNAIAEARDAFEKQDLREKLQRHHGENVDGAFYGWNESWLQAGYENWNIEEHVPKVRCPILAIRGRHDVYGTGAQLERLCALARCPLTALSPDCGHDPHIELADEMLSVMAAFIVDLT